ncbi:MAG: hypothetical protein D6802_08695 [Ardenticatenia bacterium]|nr:MAG: hypothetical protein D6802_08695 [Ardenticatenia bacterium]
MQSRRALFGRILPVGCAHTENACDIVATHAAIVAKLLQIGSGGIDFEEKSWYSENVPERWVCEEEVEDALACIFQVSSLRKRGGLFALDSYMGVGASSCGSQWAEGCE